LYGEGMARDTKIQRGRPKQEKTLEIQVSTRLPVDRNAQLVDAAAKQERSVSFILRKAAEEWLDRNGYASPK
jgi:hypothetical protein